MNQKSNAISQQAHWDQLWSSQFGHWLLTNGLHIVLVLVAAWIGTRVIRWMANKISRRLDQNVESDSMVRSESVKHRQAVASVISSVVVAVLYVVVTVDVINRLGLPVGSLVAPAAVLGAALGFGAQRIVQDLRSASSRTC
jgi:moderate conductance mechanosensitive channel